MSRYFPWPNYRCSLDDPLKGYSQDSGNIPALDWPIASLPLYKYPFEEHVEENKAEDRKCLAEVEEQFERFNKVANLLPVSLSNTNSSRRWRYYPRIAGIFPRTPTYHQKGISAFPNFLCKLF